MLKNKYSTHIMLFFISFLLAFWLLFSFSFNKTYEEAKYFATEGAQPIIQILEILNYRGESLMPYFILFFTLTALSFLLVIYLFLYIKKKKSATYPLLILCLILLIFIGINIFNKLFLFLLLLIGIALLVMMSITITVRHLYINIDSYEEGDVLQVKGPFKTEKKANMCAEKELARLKKQVTVDHLWLKSLIYSEDSKHYYVEIYLETINDDESKWGE